MKSTIQPNPNEKSRKYPTPDREHTRIVRQCPVTGKYMFLHADFRFVLTGVKNVNPIINRRTE